MYDENEETNKSGFRQTADSFLDAYSRNEVHKENIERIKNRTGVNESKPRQNDEETTNEKKDNKNPSSLEEKDKLEDKKNEIKNEEKDIKDDKEFNKKLNAQEALEDITGIGALKRKFVVLKLEVKIAIIGFLAIFIGMMTLVLFTSALKYLHVFTTAISNFFGIPEGNIIENNKTRSGLYTEEEYLFDENGKERSSEELVKMLKSDGDACKATFWNSITDLFVGLDNRCAFMRYVKKAAANKGTDASLIISTIIYGYGTQPSPSQYLDNEDVPGDYTSVVNHYEVLDKILSQDDSPITKRMLDTIIDNTISTSTSWYYDWEIEEETNSDGEVISKKGICKYKESKKKQYSLDKWKVFMRFGSRAASAFDSANNKTYAYNSSSEECNGSMSESELLQRVRESESVKGENADDITYSVDVSEALEAMKGSSDSYSSAFYQAADINSHTKDVFTNFGNITFDYANGFAFNNFPGFGASMQANSPLTTIKYDDVYTPKQIEVLIQNIISQKVDMNEILLIEDSDRPDVFRNADRSSSVVTGAYCSSYLTANLDDIKVDLRDCFGNRLATIPFDDYIIGVANAEVSNTHDNYVLSEMVAAISYALNRRSNYTKGDTIMMKSGTCDQAYCSMKEGCRVEANPTICKGCSSFYIGGSRGRNPSLYAKYKMLYETAKQFLVVSNGKVHNAHYVSTIQNEWKRKALQGMNFTQIIQETYESEGAEVIKCSEPPSTSTTNTNDETDIAKIGNKATEDYPKVSDDLGSYYGFSYKDTPNSKEISINPKWKEENLVTIRPTCSNSQFASMQFTVHKRASDNYNKAFTGICKLLTEGVKVGNETCKYTMSDLQGGTAFIEAKTEMGDFDLHAYGLAQSWNYLSSYNINGKKYSPYAQTTTKEEYLDFVNAIGGEESCKNINYVLWVSAYKDAGFEWGGNFGRNGNNGSYRGNLFQLKYK